MQTLSILRKLCLIPNFDGDDKGFPLDCYQGFISFSRDDASAHHGKGTRQLRSHRCFLHIASTALELPETKQAFQTEGELPAARKACAEDGSGNMGCAKSDSLWPA
jgi:hypothetical protein